MSHTTHNTHFPSASELIQRHWRERYRCVNTQTMTIRIWNDGNPIRMVETTTNDHSFHIACNPHHFSFQITHIASPFQWEPKPNHWQSQRNQPFPLHNCLSHQCGGSTGTLGTRIVLQADGVSIASLENCQGIEENPLRVVSEMNLISLSLCATHSSTSTTLHSQRSVGFVWGGTCI